MQQLRKRQNLREPKDAQCDLPFNQKRSPGGWSLCVGFETSRSRGPSDHTPLNMVNLGLTPQAII
jgi:hypothetical protein